MAMMVIDAIDINKMLPMVQFKDLVFMFGLLMVLLATVIQKLPIKFNPWTYLFQLMGRTANAEIIERQEKLEKMFKESCQKTNEQIKKINTGLDKANRKIDEYQAIEARRRIIQFADEISRGIGHSEEYFNNILGDVGDYKAYCDSHKNFENEKGVASMKIVREEYCKNLKNNSFLTKDTRPDAVCEGV